MKTIIAVLGASVALSLTGAAQAQSPGLYNNGAPANPGVQNWQLPSNAGNVGVTTPGHLNTGGLYQWAPTLGHTGQVLAPVSPDAYGPGIGMDAAGKPVRAIVK